VPSEDDAFADLVCPDDRGALEQAQGALRCTACGARYPVAAGIPDFVSGAPAARPRWQTAQRYELAYWTRRSDAPGPDEDDHLRRAAEGLAAQFDAATGPGWRERVAHVGPAGFGEIHHLPARVRWAVEPLAIALDAHGLLVRATGVHWVAAMGERLPFPDRWLTAALMPNVIDHVADPVRLLAELRRCLAPGAPLWLTSHVTRPALAPLLRLVARTRAGYFAGHPWAFTPDRLRGLVEQAGFRLASEQAGPAVEAPHGGLRGRLKDGLLGVRYLMAVA